MRAASEQHHRISWWSTPSTFEGWWAPILAAVAVAVGLLGEVARGDVSWPFYRLAFLAAFLGGGAALIALRRGERSMVTLLAFVPFVIVLAFGAAQAF